jgi:hypothetical protein
MSAEEALIEILQNNELHHFPKKAAGCGANVTESPNLYQCIGSPFAD